MNEQKKTVGEVIRNLRLEKGLTQKELAEGCCSKQHVYRLEASKRLPSAYIVKLFSNKLGYSLINDVYSNDCDWNVHASYYNVHKVGRKF
ncbi:helix-turn-helix transcriptional regulator [Vallitalea pronyensis]|uniref:Helix-turn-helix transcriptional regulator n=1 Tax=Vallitalea pronyensis TaxID=1348613 RepID=A0A8J8MMY5_9FIRM|nr:helix-turn-helix transcriptional regulator [Vallitalea pronyensis]QUI24213.1 helix-turn-helix transcriptional regulator [Vallitalea pronyensis]